MNKVRIIGYTLSGGAILLSAAEPVVASQTCVTNKNYKMIPFCQDSAKHQDDLPEGPFAPIQSANPSVLSFSSSSTTGIYVSSQAILSGPDFKYTV